MIKIAKNSNGDTRSAGKMPSWQEFQEANRNHIKDVQQAMSYVSNLLNRAGEKHDFTKITQEDMFYQDFEGCMRKGANFVDGAWYSLHIEKERHHLNNKCPKDVNLIDVLEMICDCVCAGMARTGNIYELKIDDKILLKAVENTVELIKDNIEIIG